MLHRHDEIDVAAWLVVKEFVGQAEQLTAVPRLDLYVPWSQGAQAEESEAAIYPRLQTQAIAPSPPEEVVFAGQERHEVA